MKKGQVLLPNEHRHVARLLAGLAIAAVSGYATYFAASHGIWQQWTYLLHTGAGFYLALVFVPYIAVHFLRTLGIKRPGVVVLGLIALMVTLVLVGTGVHIAIYGQSEPRRWIYDLHIVLSFVTIGGLLLHIVVHRLMLPAFRRTEPQWFASITRRALRSSALALTISVAAVVLASAITAMVPVTYRDEAVIQPYELTFGDHPFRPSHTETSTGGFFDPRRVGRSERCGTCHVDIYQQWQSSMHGKAASDKAYQTNVKMLAGNTDMMTTRYCEGCHALVPLLSGQLTTGGHLDTEGHMKEGISCLSCHAMSKIIHTKGVASFEFTPASDYLFGDRDGLLATKIHNYLLQIQPRKHREEMGRDLLATPQMCATCHAQFMEKVMNKWGWVQMQDDYTAWLKGPYSGQSEQNFSHEGVTRCQDCHMPFVAGEEPSANEQQHHRAHWFAAANTAIPYYDGDHEQVERVVRFLQANRLRVSIERPKRANATRSVKPVDPVANTTQESPTYFYLGEEASINVVVSNVGVGHDFPAGSTDINEAWIHVRVSDSENRLVYESGAVQPDKHVDPKAYFYRAIPVDRFGKHVWKHDLFNMIGDSYKNIVPAGASDLVPYSFTIPGWVKSPLTVTATVRYRKFNQQYALFALRAPELDLPIVDVARDSLSFPIRPRIEVETAGPRTPD